MLILLETRMTGDPGESELGEETPFDQGVPLRTNAVDESPVRLGGSRALDDVNRKLTISENGESVGPPFTGAYTDGLVPSL